MWIRAGLGPRHLQLPFDQITRVTRIQLLGATVQTQTVRTLIRATLIRTEVNMTNLSRQTYRACRVYRGLGDLSRSATSLQQFAVLTVALRSSRSVQWIIVMGLTVPPVSAWGRGLSSRHCRPPAVLVLV